jgi:hypothetical protein
MNYGDAGGQGLQGMDPALQQFIFNETEKQKLQVRHSLKSNLEFIFEDVLHGLNEFFDRDVD